MPCFAFPWYSLYLIKELSLLFLSSLGLQPNPCRAPNTKPWMAINFLIVRVWETIAKDRIKLNCVHDIYLQFCTELANRDEFSSCFKDAVCISSGRSSSTVNNNRKLISVNIVLIFVKSNGVFEKIL